MGDCDGDFEGLEIVGKAEGDMVGVVMGVEVVGREVGL